MKCLLLSTNLVIISVSFAFSQEVDTLLANQYYTKAVFYDESFERDSSINYYLTAAEIFKEKGEVQRFIQCANKAAISAYKNMDKKWATSICEGILSLNQDIQSMYAVEIAETFFLLGLVHYVDEQLEKAISYMDSTVNLHEKIYDVNSDNIVRNYKFLGKIYADEGDLEKAHENYNEAFSITQRLGQVTVMDMLDNHNNVGNIFWQEEKYEEAIDNFKQALKIGKKHLGKQHYKVIGTYNKLGLIYKDIVQYDIALEYLEEAHRLWRRKYGKQHPFVMNNYKYISEIYLANEDYVMAGMYQDRWNNIRIKSKLNREVDEADYLHHRGLTSLGQGYYERALTLFKRSLNVNLNMYRPRLDAMADNYRYLSFAYNKKKNFQEAIFFQKKALQIYKKKAIRNRQMIAHCHRHMGTIYKDWGKYNREKYEAALEELNKAMNLNCDLNRNKREVAIIYFNMADVYIEQRNFDGAYHALNNAISLLQACEQDNTSGVATYAYLLGKLYLREGKYKAALSNFERSLSIKLGIFEKHEKPQKGEDQQKRHPDLAIIYNALGETYLKMNDIENGRAYLDKAAFANVLGLESVGDFSVTNVDHIILDKFVLLETFQLKGRYAEKSYQNSWAEIDASQASGYYAIASNLISQIRKDYICASAKIDFGKGVKEFYDDIFNFGIRAWQHTGNIEFLKHIHTSSVLDDELQNRKLKEIADVPDSVIFEEKKIRKGYCSCMDKYSLDQKFSIEENLLSIKYFYKQDSSWGLFNQKLATNYPKYYQHKYNISIPELADIQEKLLSDSTMLLIFREEKNNIHILEVTRENVDVRTINKDDTFLNHIDTFVSHYTNPQKDSSFLEDRFWTFHNASRELYTRLLEPSIKKRKGCISELFIIADGVLNNISFKLLLTEPYKDDDVSAGNANYHYGQLPYLLHKFPINYFFSGRHVLKSLDMASIQPIDFLSVLIFAPFSEDAGYSSCEKKTRSQDEHSPLPGTGDEICHIVNFFDIYCYEGSYATKANLRKEFLGKEHDIYHIATHGHNCIDTSFLYCNNGIVNSGGDHVLNNYEIFDLPIRAGMVVLSTCYSSSVWGQKGEEVLSLGGAFIHAGVSSVVVTNWAIDDKESASLMGYFYEYLSKGMSKSAALQHAEMKYLKEAQSKCNSSLFAHPYYWAGYDCFGNNSPIALKK